MKKISATLLVFIFCCSVSFGQTGATFKITKNKEKPTLKSRLSVSNNLYAGLPNYLNLLDTINSEGKYLINVANPIGVEINWSNDKFVMNISANRINDTVVIFIRSIKNKDTINLNVQKFLVMKVPDPELAIGGKPILDKILKSDLLKYKKLTCFMSNDIVNGNTWFKCLSFDMVIGGNRLQSGSDTFTSFMLQAINSAHYGDIVLFVNLRVVGPDGKIRNMSDQSWQLGR